jgi:hypothetical protein
MMVGEGVAVAVGDGVEVGVVVDVAEETAVCVIVGRVGISVAVVIAVTMMGVDE